MRIQLSATLCAFLLCHSLAFSQSLSAGNTEALNELDAIRELLETTEAGTGRYALVLVEPLERLADRLMQLNQFDAADAYLDRAIQITRLHSGLHTSAQLSLIRKRIENFSNRQAWDDARELMDYLFYYYQRVPVTLNENLLDDLVALADQHLRGAIEDSEIEQGRHLSRIYQINWAMIAAAQQLYGEQSPLMAPYLYRQAQHLYLLKKGLDEGGRDRVNSNLYYTFGGNSTGWRNSQAERFYFIGGLFLLEQIKEIFGQPDSLDHEGKAMADLYIADWNLLFDVADVAATGYEAAYNSLIATNASNEQVNHLFSEPRILPIKKFYSDIELALEDLPASRVNAEVDSGKQPTYEFYFSEWSADYPAVRSPSDSYRRREVDSDCALFSFRLIAENEPTFLYKHRFRRNIGIAYEVEQIEGFQSILAGSEVALERVDQLRFRPRMIDGLPAESSGVLKYEIAAEDAGC